MDTTVESQQHEEETGTGIGALNPRDWRSGSVVKQGEEAGTPGLMRKDADLGELGIDDRDLRNERNIKLPISIVRP